MYNHFVMKKSLHTVEKKTACKLLISLSIVNITYDLIIEHRAKAVLPCAVDSTDFAAKMLCLA